MTEEVIFRRIQLFVRQLIIRFEEHDNFLELDLARQEKENLPSKGEAISLGIWEFEGALVQE